MIAEETTTVSDHLGGLPEGAGAQSGSLVAAGSNIEHVSKDEATQVKPARSVLSRRDKVRRVIHGQGIEPFGAGESIVCARKLELKTLLGSPYSGVDLNVEQGQLFCIRGHHGSGKTALLLTIAGRMRSTKGSLSVLGYKLPLQHRAVAKRVGLGVFRGLNDLDKSQKVSAAVAAEFELYGRRPTQKDVRTYLEEWHMDDCADMTIGELERIRSTQLGAVLAWVGHPDIIVLDDIETGMTKNQSITIMESLRVLVDTRNVTVIVGVLERELAAMADGVYYMDPEETARADARDAHAQEVAARAVVEAVKKSQSTGGDAAAAVIAAEQALKGAK